MHPLIAFLSFMFSPSNDWLLKQAYELFIDPAQIPAAVEQVERIQAQYPSVSADTTVYALWADVLNSNGYNREAQQTWKKLDADPLLPAEMRDDVRLKLGQALLASNQIDKAQTLFKKILENPQSPRALDARVNTLVCDLIKNDLPSAVRDSALLKNMLSPNTSSLRLHYALGLTAFAQNNYAEAIEHLSLLSENPPAQYFLGLAFRKSGQPRAALIAWQNTKHSAHDALWKEAADFQLAETYFSIGDDPLCRAACENSLQKNPNSIHREKLEFRLASLDMRAKNYAGALAHLEKVMDPELANRTTTLMAEAMIKTGQSKDLFNRLARKKDPAAGVESMYQTAWAALFENRHEQTLAYAEQGLEKFYDADFTPKLLLLQGLAFEHLGHEAEALATYQTVADRFPRSHAAAYGAHWVTLAYMRVGRPAEAVTHGAYLWNNLPTDVQRVSPDTAFWIGEAHLRLKRYEDADKYHQQFLTMAPPDHALLPNGQFQRSVALAHLNQKENALAMLDAFTRTAVSQNKSAWVSLAQLQRGNIFFNNKNYIESVVAYRASGDTPKSLFQQGLAFYRMDYFTDATQTWTKLASLFPHDPHAENGAFRAARTQFELGLTTQAVTAFNGFIRQFPSSRYVKEARLQSAHALYNAGDIAAAAPLYADYLARYPTTEDKAAITPYLATCYARLGKSVGESEKLLAGLPPSNSLADMRWQEGADHYNKKEMLEANQQFMALAAELPAHENAATALFYRGEGLFLQKQWIDAEGAFTNYLAMQGEDTSPHAPMANFHKAVVIYNQDKLLKAAKTFQAFVDKYPDHNLTIDAKQNLALCYHNLGDWNTRDLIREKYHLNERERTDEPPLQVAQKRGVTELGPGPRFTSSTPKETEVLGQAVEIESNAQ